MAFLKQLLVVSVLEISRQDLLLTVEFQNSKTQFSKFLECLGNNFLSHEMEELVGNCYFRYNSDL